MIQINELPAVPQKIKGVWRNVERGMIAIGKSADFKEPRLQLKLVSDYEFVLWRQSRPEFRNHTNIQFYKKPYDIWVPCGRIPNEYGGPIGVCNKATWDNYVLAFSLKSGIPILPQLMQSDPAETFEYLLEQVAGV